MENIIVAVMVGVIVGSFSTWLTHKFDRRRRREIRQEERERELRRMLESVMGLSRVTLSGVFVVEASEKLGLSLEDIVTARDRALDSHNFLRNQADLAWRPHRLKDERLRQVAEELNRTQGELVGKLILLPLPKTSNFETWRMEVEDLARRVENGLQAVDERMDQLGW
jgi:hypothetical protein